MQDLLAEKQPSKPEKVSANRKIILYGRLILMEFRSLISFTTTFAWYTLSAQMWLDEANEPVTNHIYDVNGIIQELRI